MMIATAMLTGLLSLTPSISAVALPNPEASCPTYGCTASVMQLSSGGYVLRGEATLPATLPKPPAGDALVRNIDTGEMQSIGIVWVERNWFCCCPTDWVGSFAEVLTMRVRAGDRLEIVVGGVDVCYATIVIPDTRSSVTPALPLIARPSSGR